jgi:hypothetical protein
MEFANKLSYMLIWHTTNICNITSQWHFQASLMYIQNANLFTNMKTLLSEIFLCNRSSRIPGLFIHIHITQHATFHSTNQQSQFQHIYTNSTTTHIVQCIWFFRLPLFLVHERDMMWNGLRMGTLHSQHFITTYSACIYA